MTDEPTALPEGNLWAWLDAEDSDGGVREVDPVSVTAIMVVHNSRAWLARQLLSLARLDPRPGRIIAVDNASTDDCASLLARELDEGVLDGVVTLEKNTGFGVAVAAAIGTDEPDWIWLLHDDSAPFSDTLSALLDGAMRRDAAIVVPKLLQPRRRNYPETLAEAGQSISRGGRRVSFVDAGDIDQHQLEPERVLGGSTAGMLVRGDVWRELGGLAPELALHRDGVDLGWRASSAGHVVTTWPRAALTHRQAGRTGERVTSPEVHPHQSDRLAGLRVAASRGAKPMSRTSLLVASGLRAGGFLLAKSPSMAGAELRAARTFAATPDATAALTARASPTAPVVPDLLPARSWSLRNGIDTIGAGIAERYRDLVRGDAGTSIDEMTGDDFAGTQTARRKLSPVLVMLLGLLLLGVVAGRTLIGGGGISGGGLLPAPADLAGAWEAYLRPNIGVAGSNAPWLLLAAFFSTFFLAMPSWFVIAALLLLPAAAGGSALLLLRSLGLRPGSAVAGASAWTGAVLLLGIVGAGDLSGMALAVTAPMLARSVQRLVQDDSTGAERLRRPAGVALWLVLVSAAWPMVLPLLTVASLVFAIVRSGRWTDVAIAMGLPWLFMAPWIPTLVRWPARLLMGADPLAWPDFPPAGFALLAGRIVESGIPPWINAAFFAGLLVCSVVGLLRMEAMRHRVIVVAGIAVPLVAGVLSSRVALATNGGEARALLSGWALLVVAAMLAPALVALRPAEDDAPATRFQRSGIAVLVVLGIVATGSWAWIGFQGPVGPSFRVLPGYVRDVVTSARDTRVLLIERDAAGALNWNVVDARQPQWGTGERELAGVFAEESGRIVQALGATIIPTDLATQLTTMGFSHLYMGGFDEEALAAVGNAAGLTRAAVRDGDVAWTVAGLPSRLRVLESRTSTPVVDMSIDAGSTVRYLSIAEGADPRWWASVGGVELEPSTDRGSVTFVVPEGVSGEISWGLRGSWAALGWQVALLVIVLVLVAPTLGQTTTARRGRS